ncbi:hypothetical protein B0J13DRAFT_527623 [Dactylonectria estremocensis]|uniref:Rhodopsin domain-containing protein n=1 Tax=Dactylonectria estremocensis TaxID=1079267 RepID=A0A9P9J2R6_9HYPO|nr:hypothetical protein B0J13DRAFT_527623 [Dactylonectria estremocensis]
MSRALRIALFCTFSLGAITITFDAMRYVFVQQTDQSTAGPLSTNDCNVGIIVACLPSLRPYLGNPNENGKDVPGSHERSSISMASHNGRRNEPSYPQNVRSELDGTNELEDGLYGEEAGDNTSKVILVDEDREERMFASTSSNGH